MKCYTALKWVNLRSHQHDIIVTIKCAKRENNNFPKHNVKQSETKTSGVDYITCA